MAVLLDWLSDDYPRFPEFQRMLREYERELTAPKAPGNRYADAILADSWFCSVDVEPGAGINRGTHEFWRNQH